MLLQSPIYITSRLTRRMPDPTPGKGFTEAQYIQTLIDVLTRTYWSRAWIVQEVVLSSLPMIVLGSATIDLRRLGHIVLLIAAFEDQKFEGTDRRVIDTFGGYRLRHLLVCRRWYRGLHEAGDNFHGLVDVLELFAFASHVTDPRDRMYAFLALQDPGTPRFEADYTISVSTAYIKFSAALARNTRSLRYLGMIKGSIDPIPTWAVDLGEGTVWQGRRVKITEYFPFQASKGRHHESRTSQAAEMSQMVVQGRIVDTVGSLSNVARLEDDTFPMDNVKLLQEVEDLATLLPEGAHLNEETTASWAKRMFIALLAFDRGPYLPVEERPLSVEELLGIYNNYAKTGKHESSSNLFFMDQFGYAINDCHGKRLFVGANEQRLGFGPFDVSSGDKVCILHGSDVPVLLREQEEGYWFIGQCYFEGWMHGDLVDWEIEEADELNLI